MPTSTATSATSARAVIPSARAATARARCPAGPTTTSGSGWIDPQDLPWELDPERGWIATANNDIQPAGYPHLIAKDFHEPNRRDRIAELLVARDDHDVASMLAIQLDTVSRAVAPLLAHLCALEPHTDAQREALESLASLGRGPARGLARGRTLPGVDQRDHDATAGRPDGPRAVRRLSRVPRDLPVPRAPRHAGRPGRPRRDACGARRRDHRGRRPNLGRAPHARAVPIRWRASRASTRSSSPARSRSAATARRWPKAGSIRCSATARP